jgi:hypothetical protein
MAVKKAAVAKKPVAKAPAKAAARKKHTKGDYYGCEVCGLGVTITEIGGVVVEERSVLLCCGKPMKQKAAAKKPVKK